ncbi:MAG: AI-2E family transporter, partial [Pseudobdellovibrionaceae bacterium]
VMGFSTNIASQLPDIVLSLFIFCCASYLFLAEGRKIKFIVTKNQLMPANELDPLITSFQKACYSTLIGSLIVGGVQALTLSIGSFVLGSQHVFLIFLITFIFSFIPILGAAPVGFFLAFISAVKGDYAIMAGYIFVGLFAGTIDNIIRPWLVRGDQNINAIVMLFAIIGAIVLLGLPGLFLGPMFVSAAVSVYSLYVFPSEPAASGNDQDF